MRKILIIEDEKSLRNDIAEILRFEGYEVTTAENGLVGIRKIQEFIPDLILCDVMMPEMDGFEVLTKVRENNTTQLTPFIFVTAMAERENNRYGMNLGADDYIVKPFTRNELLNAVNTSLHKSKKAQEKEESVLSELKLRLIRNLPHELLTPLNIIIGFGRIIEDHSENYKPEEIASFGKSIHESGINLYRLIQNYLLYAELELRNHSINTNETMEITSEICRYLSEQVAISHNRVTDLNISLEGNINTTLIGKDEFKIIVEELLDNAFKFSKSGTPVSISFKIEDSRLYMSIVDKGIGMSVEDIAMIAAFMQFNRQKQEQQGSGLGLIIAQKIVELYDGKLEVTSIPGNGTTVIVWFPLPQKLT